MSRLARLMLLTIAISLGACASAGSERRNTISNRDILIRDQLLETRATNAYEAVQRLRSRWLQPHGTTVGSAPQLEGGFAGDPGGDGILARVYLDDQQLGDIEALRGIEIAAVHYVQFYRAAEAAARWGRVTAAAPVIYVSTRRLAQ